MLRTLLTATVLVLFVAASSPVSADLLYQEDFEVVGSSFASQGWSGVQAGGTSLTSLTANPSLIDASGDLEGTRNARVGNTSGSDLWYWSDEPSFDTSDYTDLKVSILHIENGDVEVDDGYRLALNVDGDWYVQDDHIEASTSTTSETDEVVLASTTFIKWTAAPGDDTTAWSEPGDGAMSLPSGTVSAIGVMVLQTQGSEELRFDDIQINGVQIGSAVPEPSAFALGLFALGFIGRRRRQR